MTSTFTNVLITPLDWGLGHVTRCIPVVKNLERRGVKVFVAATYSSIALLQQEVPDCVFLEIEGYAITYRKNPQKSFWGLLAQVPGVVKKIRSEQKWLDNIIVKHRIDAVISDNRFGMHSQKVPCIYITHQVFIETGFRFASKIATAIHRRIMQQFTCCWIPDVPQQPGLAGKLSHPQKMPAVPATYVGMLSRFVRQNVATKQQWTIVLSGPEPQRTLIEQKIIAQLKNITSAPPVFLVRGLPAHHNLQTGPVTGVTFFDHLPAKELQRLMSESETIIARSGYSTVMDLVTLGKPALLIPTPGQPEQEYLSGHLQNENLFYSVSQKDLDISRDVQKILKAVPFENTAQQHLLNDAIDSLLRLIQ